MNVKFSLNFMILQSLKSILTKTKKIKRVKSLDLAGGDLHLILPIYRRVRQNVLIV